MQLVAYGAQDIYLTGNPQITFFKVVYRRHTNFSMESIEQTFNGAADFGKKVTCTISRNGDLIHRIYLQATLPQVLLTGENDRFRWLNWIGHVLVRNVDIEIGGQRIDKHYGDWLHIWNELTQEAGHQIGYANMVGNVPRLTQVIGGGGESAFDPFTFNCDSTACMPETTLYIPLQFWFCRNPGLALPLIALQYHEVKINLEFRDAKSCYWAVGEYTSSVPSLTAASLYVDYIYLDTDERRRFAQVSHEYLIEQLQFTGDETVTSASNKLKLNFNHPVKELIWVVQPDSNVDAASTRNFGGPQWFNYTDAIDATYYTGTPNDPNGGGIPGAAMGGATNYPMGLPLTGITNRDTNYLNNAVFPTSGSTTLTPDAITGKLGRKGVEGLGFDNLGFADSTNSPHPMFDGASGMPLALFDSGANTTAYAKLQLNGHDRFSERQGRYFNLVQPYQHHTNIPATGINVYSFGLKPEEHQPSGTCNFSRIDNATLALSLTAATTKSGRSAKVRVYATNYNVLRIMSGMGGLFCHFDNCKWGRKAAVHSKESSYYGEILCALSSNLPTPAASICVY
jgi:hypothetical protein